MACLLSATLRVFDGVVFSTTGATRDGGEDDGAGVRDGVGCPLPSIPSLAAAVLGEASSVGAVAYLATAAIVRCRAFSTIVGSGVLLRSSFAKVAMN